MTEDIGSDKHRRPSQADIDIAKLKERHMALVSDVGDVKEMLRDHITESRARHSELMGLFNKHLQEDAVVHSSVLRNSADIKTLSEASAETRRDPATFWTSVVAGVTAVGTIIYTIITGKPPSTP